MLLRYYLTLLHRYSGLCLACFLIVAGLTGSVIAFAKELDRLLNPTLFTVEPKGKKMPPAEMVSKAESHFKNALVRHISLPQRPEDAVILSLTRKENSDPIPEDQVFMDPYTGDILGKRYWGVVGVDRTRLIPFLYKLHYSLHLEASGIFFLGIIAIIWFFDCFVGIYLAWPRQVSF